MCSNTNAWHLCRDGFYHLSFSTLILKQKLVNRWRHGLRGVVAEIIEHRLSDRASWRRDQADVAIIKKYTGSELKMKPCRQRQHGPG